ncbi:MAG: SUMF1/EgtB/PvdO family nonheme iron enzyme [Gammaproteobacteria bacterium]|nr:SUMF1/EgtB/PvdO family nonheme iron enzyme [Gammaproteobacteria bacterium]
MTNFPLGSFLASLAADGIVLNVRDYDRLLLALRAQGEWDLGRLKNVLAALLARNDEQQRIIIRKFDRFFLAESEEEKTLADFDIRQVLADLQAIAPRPKPVPPPLVPRKKTKSASPEPRKPFAWRRLAAAALFLIIVAGFILYPPSKELKEPVLETSRGVLDFGSLAPGAREQKPLELRNSGKALLTIERIILLKPSPPSDVSPFSVDQPVRTLPPGEQLAVPVFFKPAAEGRFSAVLEIHHNAKNKTDTVKLFGEGRIEPSQEEDKAKRIYENVPYLKKVIYEPLQRSETWKHFLALSALLLLLTLLYWLHLRRLKTGPHDKKPAWDPKAPRFFHGGAIGGKPEPFLDDETLAHLADSMGYFNSEQPGKRLNVPASILATAKTGGIPECVFFSSARIRTLLILEDANAEALQWNFSARELAAGMERCGIPVIYGRFQKTPAHFVSQNGMRTDLEDLEDQRHGILLLLFTDGKRFYHPSCAFALERLAHWPMTAWLDLRAPRFWDEEPKHGLPVYPASKEGIIRAVERFMTERGAHGPKTKSGGVLPDLSEMSAAARVEYLLADTLPWAQACAMIQPISDGLADALRREFFPYLPPERIEYLYALPNTMRTQAGLRFADEILKELRQKFFKRRSEAEQQAVLAFILAQVEAARPDAPEDSLAHLSWEALRERVRLEQGGDLKRFGELLQTPLRRSLGDSLANYAFPGQEADKKISLRIRPERKADLQRLQRVPGNPLRVGSFLSAWHRTMLVMLAAVLLASTLWMGKLYQDSLAPMMNLAVEGPTDTLALLEKHENEKWVVAGDPGAIGIGQGKHLSEEQKYRLTLYGNGYRTTKKFKTQKNKKTKLLLERINVEADCVEEHPDIGLTITRCFSKQRNTQKTRKELKTLSWRERLGDKAPEGRMMSVGVGFSTLSFPQMQSSESPFPRTRSSESSFPRTRSSESSFPRTRESRSSIKSPSSALSDLFLETGSADVVYLVQPDKSGAWRMDRALAKFRADLAEGAIKSQIIWWTEGALLEEPVPQQAFAGFERVAALGKISAKNLNEIFAPGEDIVVSEKELLLAAGQGSASGHGQPIALIRPEREEISPEQQQVQAPLIAAADVGILLVEVRPGSANVTVSSRDEPLVRNIAADGKLELPAGEWLVAADEKGYKKFEKTMEILAGKETRLAIKLEKIRSQYALTVNTVPEDARVRIMNIKPRYEAGILLKPGRYDIEVSREGYEMRREWMTLEEADKIVEVELTEILTGTLIATVEPASADIQAARPDGSDSRTLKSKKPVELPPGEWLITAQAKGYEREQEKISMEKGAERSVQLVLQTKQNTIAATLDPKNWRDPVSGLDFVRIKGGCFQMSSPKSEKGRYKDEGSQHKVCVKDFWLAATEVTNAQYRKFKPKHNSKEYEKNSLNGDSQPAVYVSWQDAVAFTEWLNRQHKGRYEFRLPTEAEWEYAARAGTTTARYWGDDPNAACKYANVRDKTLKQAFGWSDIHNCTDGYAVTAPVGRFRPNGFGLYDILGNVWEWTCSKWENPYNGEEKRCISKNRVSGYRVFRGGSWDLRPRGVRSAVRSSRKPDGRDNVLGFRPARIK